MTPDLIRLHPVSCYGRLFEGPKGKLVTTMKRVSIANLSFAVISAPVLYFVTSLADAPAKGIAMSVLLLTFGGFTTAALTYATKTYVKTIWSVPGSTSMTVITPTFFGNELETIVDWKAVRACETYHPFATFEANGRTYYLDEVGEPSPEFQDKLQQALEVSSPSEDAS